MVLLGYAVLRELIDIFTAANSPADLHLKPFGAIIFLTPGWAIFDLGKTILEDRS